MDDGRLFCDLCVIYQQKFMSERDVILKRKWFVVEIVESARSSGCYILFAVVVLVVGGLMLLTGSNIGDVAVLFIVLAVLASIFSQ